MSTSSGQGFVYAVHRIELVYKLIYYWFIIRTCFLEKFGHFNDLLKYDFVSAVKLILPLIVSAWFRAQLSTIYQYSYSYICARLSCNKGWLSELCGQHRRTPRSRDQSRNWATCIAEQQEEVRIPFTVVNYEKNQYEPHSPSPIPPTWCCWKEWPRYLTSGNQLRVISTSRTLPTLRTVPVTYPYTNLNAERRKNLEYRVSKG